MCLQQGLIRLLIPEIEVGCAAEFMVVEAPIAVVESLEGIREVSLTEGSFLQRNRFAKAISEPCIR